MTTNGKHEAYEKCLLSHRINMTAIWDKYSTLASKQIYKNTRLKDLASQCQKEHKRLQNQNREKILNNLEICNYLDSIDKKIENRIHNYSFHEESADEESILVSSLQGHRISDSSLRENKENSTPLNRKYSNVQKCTRKQSNSKREKSLNKIQSYKKLCLSAITNPPAKQLPSSGNVFNKSANKVFPESNFFNRSVEKQSPEDDDLFDKAFSSNSNKPFAADNNLFNKSLLVSANLLNKCDNNQSLEKKRKLSENEADNDLITILPPIDYEETYTEYKNGKKQLYKYLVLTDDLTVHFVDCLKSIDKQLEILYVKKVYNCFVRSDEVIDENIGIEMNVSPLKTTGKNNLEDLVAENKSIDKDENNSSPIELMASASSSSVFYSKKGKRNMSPVNDSSNKTCRKKTNLSNCNSVNGAITIDSTNLNLGVLAQHNSESVVNLQSSRNVGSFQKVESESFSKNSNTDKLKKIQEKLFLPISNFNDGIDVSFPIKLPNGKSKIKDIDERNSTVGLMNSTINSPRCESKKWKRNVSEINNSGSTYKFCRRKIYDSNVNCLNRGERTEPAYLKSNVIGDYTTEGVEYLQSSADKGSFQKVESNSLSTKSNIKFLPNINDSTHASPSTELINLRTNIKDENTQVPLLMTSANSNPSRENKILKCNAKNITKKHSYNYRKNIVEAQPKGYITERNLSKVDNYQQNREIDLSQYLNKAYNNHKYCKTDIDNCEVTKNLTRETIGKTPIYSVYKWNKKENNDVGCLKKIQSMKQNFNLINSSTSYTSNNGRVEENNYINVRRNNEISPNENLYSEEQLRTTILMEKCSISSNDTQQNFNEMSMVRLQCARPPKQIICTKFMDLLNQTTESMIAQRRKEISKNITLLFND